MKRITLSLLTLFAFALPARAAEQATGSATDPMASWVPPKITKEAQDRKEIAAVCKAMDAARDRGDVNAAADLVDFPVLMATDDSSGEAKTASWNREKWVEVMAPFYKPMPNAKMTTKPSVVLLTDSLASMTDQWTMTTGKKKLSGRSATLFVRVNGQWKVKSMAEGGWGDMMKEQPASASQATQPAEPAQATQANPPSGTDTTSPPSSPPAQGSTPAETQGTGAQPTK
jgi:hypothetical protein